MDTNLSLSTSHPELIDFQTHNLSLIRFSVERRLAGTTIKRTVRATPVLPQMSPARVRQEPPAKRRRRDHSMETLEKKPANSVLRQALGQGVAPGRQLPRKAHSSRSVAFVTDMPQAQWSSAPAHTIYQPLRSKAQAVTDDDDASGAVVVALLRQVNQLKREQAAQADSVRTMAQQLQQLQQQITHFTSGAADRPMLGQVLLQPAAGDQQLLMPMEQPSSSSAGSAPPPHQSAAGPGAYRVSPYVDLRVGSSSESVRSQTGIHSIASSVKSLQLLPSGEQGVQTLGVRRPRRVSRGGSDRSLLSFEREPAEGPQDPRGWQTSPKDRSTNLSGSPPHVKAVERRSMRQHKGMSQETPEARNTLNGGSRHTGNRESSDQSEMTWEASLPSQPSSISASPVHSSELRGAQGGQSEGFEGAGQVPALVGASQRPGLAGSTVRPHAKVTTLGAMQDQLHQSLDILQPVPGGGTQPSGHAASSSSIGMVSVGASSSMKAGATSSGARSFISPQRGRSAMPSAAPRTISGVTDWGQELEGQKHGDVISMSQSLVHPQTSAYPLSFHTSPTFVAPVPAHWSLRGSRRKWYNQMMSDTKWDMDRLAKRRAKSVAVIRLLGDYAFAVKCSLDLLRRDRGGAVAVHDPPSSSSSQSSSASGSGTGANEKPQVQLLRDFRLGNMKASERKKGAAGCWSIHVEDQLELKGFARERAQALGNSPTGCLPFVADDSTGRHVRGFQVKMRFRPAASQGKPARAMAVRGVCVAKLLRGGTEDRTSICAKLRSKTSPDPNGDEDVVQWIDELIMSGII